ncbi:MAG: WD40 repeat domain-containing protein [Anaerolinea sp.]|nr:WD40 repeat domain-containing protein [Anaerolinea sp.]
MSSYETITLSNAAQLTEIGRVSCGFITQTAWSRDGKWLGVAHGSGVWLWEGGLGGTPDRTIASETPIKGFDFSPDGTAVVTGGADTTVRLFMTHLDRPLFILRGHGDTVNSVAFSLDGRMIASAGGDRDVRLFDMRESVKSTPMSGHTEEINAVAFGLRGQVVASGARDATIRVWDTGLCKLMYTLDQPDWVRDIAASPDHKRFAAASKAGVVSLYEFETGAHLGMINAHPDGVDTVAFSPDGALLATGGRDGLVKVWDAQTGAELITLSGHERPVLTVAFSPTGGMLISGSGDNTLRAWAV